MYLFMFFSLESLFGEVDLDLDDDVFIYEVNTKCSQSCYRLHEVYKINEGDPIISHIGSWSRGDRSDFMKEDKNSEIIECDPRLFKMLRQFSHFTHISFPKKISFTSAI